jgi:hypothetical protein
MKVWIAALLAVWALNSLALTSQALIGPAFAAERGSCSVPDDLLYSDSQLKRVFGAVT